MKNYITFALSIILLSSCVFSETTEDIVEENWSSRKAEISQTDSLVSGQSYLSVYSQMYSYTISTIECH